jgi:hypothetical protein
MGCPQKAQCSRDSQSYRPVVRSGANYYVLNAGSLIVVARRFTLRCFFTGATTFCCRQEHHSGGYRVYVLSNGRYEFEDDTEGNKTLPDRPQNSHCRATSRFWYLGDPGVLTGNGMPR